MAEFTIHGKTETTSMANADEFLIWVAGSAVTRRITKANALSGYPTAAANVLTLPDGKQLTVGGSMTLPAGGVPGLTAANAFTGQNSFNTTVGLYGIKSSFPHNAATALCRIAIGGGGTLTASYLVALTLYSVNTSSSALYGVTMGYNDSDVFEIVKSVFGHTTITLTAASDTANRRITLTLTQVNGSSQINTIEVSVIPVIVAGNAAITLTML